jgi:hypothetical protein
VRSPTASLNNPVSLKNKNNVTGIPYYKAYHFGITEQAGISYKEG